MLRTSSHLLRFGLLALLLATAPALADNHDTAAPAAEDTLSINFRNVDIAQFIESVSTLTGRNFLVDRRVTGRITIIASQPIPRDSLYDVMLSVLQFYGFTAIPDGDITKIIPFAEGLTLTPSAVDDEPHAFITEILEITNVAAAEMVAVVRPIMTRQAQIAVIPSINSLIIADTAASMERIKGIIARLDRVEIDEFEIIPIANANVDATIATVTAIFRANNPTAPLNMHADQRTNRIIISGTPEVRGRIKSIIQALDIPISNNANIKVIYLRYADAQNLANILTRLTGSEAFQAIAASQEADAATSAPAQPQVTAAVQPQPPPTAPPPAQQGGEVQSGIQADVGLNALIVSGSSNFIAAVEGIIRQLDIQKAQIIIEVIIAELTDDFVRELGVDWVVSGPGGAFSADLSGRLGALVQGAAGGTAGLLRSGIGLASGGVVGAAVAGSLTNGWGALFRLLNTDVRSNIIATPYLVTLDNEQATFSVGENRPFVTGTVTSDTGQTTRNVERRNVGITLVVTPQVTAGDTVKLDIDQEVSNAVPSVEGGDTEFGIVTTERKITTSVQVRDGGLIILGGLLSSEQTENIRRVPGLGDIPYLGSLFRQQRSTNDRTNIMIFMRPRVLQDEAAIASLSHAKYNNLRRRQLSLPQYNSYIAKTNFPKLQDLRDTGFFTDYGSRPTIENLLESQE